MNYRQTINDNILVVVMIETPTGVANAYDIASVPGVDVVIIGNNDLFHNASDRGADVVDLKVIERFASAFATVATSLASA